MEKSYSIAILAIFNLFLLIEAAPRTLDAIELKNLSTVADIEAPVRYDGAQLWSVSFADDQTKRVVIGLKRNFG